MLQDYEKVENVKDVQIALCYMLKSFHQICLDNELTYNVFGGTMLGAVRHNGFIPWDDDIDVTMPFCDYEKLGTVIEEKYSMKFEFIAYPNENCIYHFGKLYLKDSILFERKVRQKYGKGSLYIDIFPVGAYPTDNANHFFKTLSKYDKNRYLSITRPSLPRKWWKRILYPIYFVFRILPLLSVSPVRYIKKEISLQRSVQIENNDYLLLQGAGWNERGKLEKSKYYDRKLYQFENFKVYGIRDYDEHLKNLYGDYMTLPSEEKRKSDHDYSLFIRKEVMEKIREEFNNG